MVLSAYFSNPLVMSSQEVEVPKYTYRFTFKQEGGDGSSDDGGKAEIEAYVRDVLGMGSERSKDKVLV